MIMGMSPMEQIMTLVLWTLMAGVFLYYRRLAIKQQQKNQKLEESQRNASCQKDRRL
jgi:preprotein translocase subunit YajC